MPLNEREQRILEEIERQFYEQDPKLAETVAKTTLESVNRKWQRLAVVGFVAGLIVMFGFFLSNTVVALGGFIVMVVSAAWLAMNFRKTRASGGNGSLESWFGRFRQRWGRDR